MKEIDRDREFIIEELANFLKFLESKGVNTSLISEAAITEAKQIAIKKNLQERLESLRDYNNQQIEYLIRRLQEINVTSTETIRKSYYSTNIELMVNIWKEKYPDKSIPQIIESGCSLGIPVIHRACLGIDGLMEIISGNAYHIDPFDLTEPDFVKSLFPKKRAYFIHDVIRGAFSDYANVADHQVISLEKLEEELMKKGYSWLNFEEGVAFCFFADVHDWRFENILCLNSYSLSKKQIVKFRITKNGYFRTSLVNRPENIVGGESTFFPCCAKRS